MTTVKSVAGKALKTGAISATSGFATDVAKQVIVDDKNLKEVDYKKAETTSAVAGVTGAIGSVAGSVSKIVKDKIKPKANVKIADDVSDGMNSMTTKASKSTKKTTGTGNVDVGKKQMAGSSGTKSLGAGVEGGSQASKDLYRAVGPEEFDDIFATNSFRQNPNGNSYAAKQFGVDFDETLNLANQPIMKDTAAIVKVTVPESVYKQLNLMELDRYFLKSGSATVEPEMLDMFNKSILNIQHVY